MISRDRTIYFQDDPAKNGRGNNYVTFLDEIDERTAMTQLVFDVLEQAVEVMGIWDDNISFRLEGPNGRRELYYFSGYAHYLRPLFLVAVQYIRVLEVIGRPLLFTHGRLPEGADVTGEQYGQPWGDLAWRYPLKLAIIRALSLGSGPIHVTSDLIMLPLDDLLKQMLGSYERSLSEATAR